MLFAAACSDEPVEPDTTPSTTGSVENDGDRLISVIHLSASGLPEWEPVEDAVFEMVDPVNRNSFTFSGAVRYNPAATVLGQTGAATCRIAFGTEGIPDGYYYLTVKGEGVPQLGVRRIRFERNIGAEEPSDPMDYEDLQGEGTAESPYLINDAGDFLSLLWYLEEDPTHACGRFFRQTSSFELPRRSQIIDGHIWVPVTFSGNYDGGGFELKSLVYQGASDPTADSGVGLFKELYSATVTNLSVTGALVLNAASDVGLIAGAASGNTLLEGITVSGTITASSDNVGGLIGRAEGDLTLEGITLKSLVVNGADGAGSNIGGLVGSFSGGKLSVGRLSTPDHIFSITGHDHVGGLVGCVMTAEKVGIANVTLEHSVDRESSGIKVIYGSGVYTGGLVGYLFSPGEVTVDNVSLKAPVRGREDVGGLFGNAKGVSSAGISTTVLTSVVAGQVATGGFFGRLELSCSSATLTFRGDDNTTRFVVKSSAEADVTGGSHTGGLIGYLDGNGGKVVFDGKVEVAVNVSGTEHTGGAVGYMSKAGGFDVSGLNFSSTTMRVSSVTECAGGVVGKASESTMTGPLSFNLTSRIPDKSELKSGFSGVVTASNYAGGIAGAFDGTLTGVGSDATVTATADNAGGICGYFHGTVKSCAFYGHVAAAANVAGIYAKSSHMVTVSDCLNLADISGGIYSAGIAAYTATPYDVPIKIERSFNKGNLTGAKGSGGIAAYVHIDSGTADAPSGHYIEIVNCGNSGNITANGDSSHSVAGIVGHVNSFFSYIHSCANHGDITSSTVQFVIGGVVGEIGYSDKDNWNYVYECMNAGTISCDVTSTKLGGVVGHLHSGNLAYTAEIHDCYNIGSLPNDQKDDTGGILGYAAYRTNTYRTFNRGKISHGNAIIGTHKSGSMFNHSDNYYLEGTGASWPSSTSVKQDKLADKTVYHNFDFNNIWDITADGPVLRNCPFKTL